MTEIKHYIDLIWRWCREQWARSLAAAIIATTAFGFGGSLEKKQITDDCKFMGVFRDGPQAYSCQQRVR